jgi:hypothetical protein
LLADSLVNACIASCACGGLERLGGGVYCGRLTWCCSGECITDIEGSEGSRWSEGERAVCCCFAASLSRLADMLVLEDGDHALLLHAHCLSATEIAFVWGKE